MHPFAVMPLLLVMAFVGWLLWDGWSSGAVWVKGGAPDRLTRDLDMHSFAHKVDLEEQPLVYRLNMVLFASVEGMGLYFLVVR